jgi:Sulfite exporter TauE/SafE
LSWELVWLCLAALAAGAVNSIAGGGPLLTFPALLVGLSSPGAADAAVVANATSTVALVPGSLAGAWGYRREMKRARRWLYLLVGPSLAGGAIGALLVTRLDPTYLAALVPWLLLTAALLFLAESLLPQKRRSAPGSDRPRPELRRASSSSNSWWLSTVAISGQAPALLSGRGLPHGLQHFLDGGLEKPEPLLGHHPPVHGDRQLAPVAVHHFDLHPRLFPQCVRHTGGMLPRAASGRAPPDRYFLHGSFPFGTVRFGAW